MLAPGPLTLGTAGHVDHGKTALVGALTGVDTDRLPEERERGLTIVLGYAPLVLPSGRRLSVVDVPGHERFVRTMVAGASGIDGFLAVVAADDGVMPQTVEHASVLRALGVTGGVVAVTKVDTADPVPAADAARELFAGCEVVACSARAGTGLSALRAALDRLAARLPSRADASGASPRLHVDRVFTVAGRGTVVTGTLWSGRLAVGDALQLLPAGTAVRVRGLEVHGQALGRVDAGQRVAVNLAGVRAAGVSRGDVLVASGGVAPATVLDCALELHDARHGEDVHVHHGTREAPGRLIALDEDLWQLRLDRPLLAVDGDRLVVRRSSPAATLGGGVVLDASARPHGSRPELIARLQRRRAVVLDEEVTRRGGGGGPGDEVTRRGGGGGPGDEGTRRGGGGGLDDEGGDGVSIESVGGAQRGVAPRGPAGVPAPVLAEPALVRAAGVLAAALLEAGAAMRSEAQLLEAVPPTVADRGAPLRILRVDGRAVRVSGRLYAHASVVGPIRDTALRLIDRDGSVTLGGLRDELGASRKVAQAFLEHFDDQRVTRRLPDDRRMRFQRSTGAAA